MPFFLTEPPSESCPDRPHSPLLHEQASSFASGVRGQSLPQPPTPPSAEIQKSSGILRLPVDVCVGYVFFPVSWFVLSLSCLYASWEDLRGTKAELRVRVFIGPGDFTH